MKFEEGMV